MREIRCTVCGRTVEVQPHSNRKYCEACARDVIRERQRQYQRKRKKLPAEEKQSRPRPARSIREVNAEARAHGMSYGQWAARLDEQRRKGMGP